MSNFFTLAKEHAQGIMSGPGQRNQDGEYVATDGQRKPSGHWSALPASLRQGLVNIDPSLEGARALHVILLNFKMLAHNHETLARNNESTAHAFDQFGADQIPGHRHDSSGDTALSDIAYHIAACLREEAHVNSSHTSRLDEIREGLACAIVTENSLSSSRGARSSATRELRGLTNGQYTRGEKQRDRIPELEERIKNLTEASVDDERRVGAELRDQMRNSLGDYFSELESYGEKLKIVARYGKQLSGIIPSGPPEFPAPVRTPSTSLWDGADKARALRNSLHSAIEYHITQGSIEPVLVNDGTEAAGTGTDQMHLNMTVPIIPPSHIYTQETLEEQETEESAHRVPETGTAPVDPTVAETGIIPDGNSGPKSGQLRMRVTDK